MVRKCGRLLFESTGFVKKALEHELSTLQKAVLNQRRYDTNLSRAGERQLIGVAIARQRKGGRRVIGNHQRESMYGDT